MKTLVLALIGGIAIVYTLGRIGSATPQLRQGNSSVCAACEMMQDQ